MFYRGSFSSPFHFLPSPPPLAHSALFALRFYLDRIFLAASTFIYFMVIQFHLIRIFHEHFSVFLPLSLLLFISLSLSFSLPLFASLHLPLFHSLPLHLSLSPSSFSFFSSAFDSLLFFGVLSFCHRTYYAHKYTSFTCSEVIRMQNQATSFCWRCVCVCCMCCLFAMPWHKNVTVKSKTNDWSRYQTAFSWKLFVALSFILFVI